MSTRWNHGWTCRAHMTVAAVKGDKTRANWPSTFRSIPRRSPKGNSNCWYGHSCLWRQHTDGDTQILRPSASRLANWSGQ